MAVAFHSDGSTPIQTLISTREQTYEETNFEELYSLEHCKSWIHENEFKQVALQIPDELQKDAAKITQWMERNTNAHCFVLADTSYGSCCVDEVSAEHYEADSIVHFGHSCLSLTSRLPSLLVFDKASIDVQACSEKFRELVPDTAANILLLYDVAYFHAIGQLQRKLGEFYSHVTTSAVNISSNGCGVADDQKSLIRREQCKHESNPSTNSDSCVKCCGRVIQLDKQSIDSQLIFFIGHESLTLSNFMVIWSKCTFYSYNPQSNICRKEALQINRTLGKRYFLIEKAKDAQIVGIVVGTLGVANYLKVIERMKSLLKKAGKKYYTFVIGKLNVAKLANFMEIDIFVLVACPENSLLDNAEFYRPVITPFELEVACNPERQWNAELVTDFQSILPGGGSHVPLPEGDIEEHSDVSLITGSYRKMGVSKKGDQSDKVATALVERNANTQVSLTGASDAVEFLSQRSWRGLEQALGQTPVTKAVEGRKGIAISYEEEPKK